MRLKNLEKLQRELLLPPLLAELIASGRWTHPGDDVLLKAVPFITDPLVFHHSKKEMLQKSGPLMGPGRIESEGHSEYRGSAIGERDLPWLDVEKSLYIIANKNIGGDVGIVLDYRPEVEPRVVGGDWHSGHGIIYREISPTFDAFAELIGLI